VTPDYQADGVTLYHGDCRAVLPTLPAESFDLVFTDPPYPCIDRPYGRLTEAEWFDLMRAVVPEVRRVLKPSGSAVFVLQPNSRKVGSLRAWLFEFQAWLCRDWNVVQDAYWWNTSAMPLGGACKYDLMRPSVRHVVWAGAEDCYRNQAAALWPESRVNEAGRMARRFEMADAPSRARSATGGPRDCGERLRTRVAERGGVTPFNVFPLGSDGRWSGGTDGHPASTPLALCDWWLRYVCPPGGAVLDPFAGSGTTGVAALRQGKTFVGVEKQSEYVAIARKRLSEVHGPLFAPREVAADA
jgi:16S rRNA G966 N2-methylase RsmD